MAMFSFFKKKCPLLIIFYVKILFRSFFLDFRNVRLKSVTFQLIVPFITFLSSPYFLEITIMVHEKNTMISKMHLWHAFSKACKKIDTFL